MNKITQLKEVRRALCKILKTLEPMEGKNLNRNKKFTAFDELCDEFENNPPPFEFNGLLGGWILQDRQCVDLSRLREKIAELENVIHELDLFDNGDADEYKTLQDEISKLVVRQREIKLKYSSIPSYFLEDFCKTK
ncbi:coil containing protein [Vibrio phage 1.084.O._10N.261.49.F5]|nr:coil containing protein [Vibrio phage 1.084.O._10N.261.49.F5]